MVSIFNKTKKFKVHPINKERSVFGEYHHLFPQLKSDPERFKKYVRMDLPTFNYLLSKTTDSLTKKWCNLHSQRILPEEKLVLTLRFLITGSTYSNLSFSFRMGISTVSSIIQDTMKVIWSCLQPIHMPIPTEADFLKISKRFQEKWAFPHCLGAIDGRHIRIKKPANSGSLYYNYKKFHSIVLQAVIDADYKYVFIDVGSFGHMSDGGTFQNSSLCKALTANLLDIPKPSMLPNSTTVMPFFFISDGAYSLSDKFMKPYSRIDLSPKKKKFNKRLSRARVVVENGFGYTSQVFRIYYTTIDKPHHIVNLIVQSTCVLHNMLIDRGQKDIFVATSSSGVGIDDLIPISGTPGNNEINFTGKKVRDKLKDYLIQD